MYICMYQIFFFYLSETVSQSVFTRVCDAPCMYSYHVHEFVSVYTCDVMEGIRIVVVERQQGCFYTHSPRVLVCVCVGAQ